MGSDSSDGAGEAATGTPDGSGADTRRRMTRALRAVRREGYKAAVIEAVVYAAAAFLGSNFLLAVAGPLAGTSLPGPTVVGAAMGLVVLVASLWLRLRRPPVEQFEAVNPPVAEALRTARDAVEDGAESRMATRLYDDVLDRLRSTSSIGLVHVRRVAGTLVVVIALSILTTQVVILDIGLGGGGDGPGTAPDPAAGSYSGLQDGDAVLGDAEDVSAGDQNLTARIDSVGGDERLDDTDQFPSAAGGGGGGSGGIDSQQAGYDQPELLEDADLIREYNLRIREDDT